jgi:predicted metal-dependent hydrolase
LAGDERQFVQGLIQVAVALHHHSTGNAEGALSLMTRAEQNLSPFPGFFGEIDLAALRAAIARWLHFLTEGGPAPAAIAVRSLEKGPF